jgi:hypothetical protein
MPGGRHGVSASASETEPAKLLAVFMVDQRDGTDDPVRELRLNSWYGDVASVILRAAKLKRTPALYFHGGNSLLPGNGPLSGRSLRGTYCASSSLRYAIASR